MGAYGPLVLAPAEGLGALWAPCRVGVILSFCIFVFFVFFFVFFSFLSFLCLFLSLLSFCLSVILSYCLIVFLPFCLFVFLSFCIFVFLYFFLFFFFFFLPFFLFAFLPFFLFVILSFCIFAFLSFLSFFSFCLSVQYSTEQYGTVQYSTVTGEEDGVRGWLIPYSTPLWWQNVELTFCFKKMLKITFLKPLFGALPKIGDCICKYVQI